MLSAQDPTIWNICRTKESEIAGVIVSGYYGAAVLGVDLSVPVAIHTRVYSPGVNCSQPSYHVLKSRLSYIKDPTTNKSIGRKTITTVEVNDHRILIGSPPSHLSELICSSDRKIEDFIMDPL